MLAAEAVVATDRASVYLGQFCKHAAAMGGSHGRTPNLHGHGESAAMREVRVHAEWSEADGVVEFAPWGRCTLQASKNHLRLHVEAGDDETLQRIEGIVARDLVDRLGRRDHLVVEWVDAAPSNWDAERP